MMSDASPPSLDGPVERLLQAVTRTVCRHPLQTILIVAGLTAASVAYTVDRLQFKTDRQDLIDSRAKYHRCWLDYVEQFGDTDDLLVVVEGSQREEVQRALDDIGQQMERQPEHFQNVFYRFDPAVLQHKGLQYLNPEQLAGIASQLEQFGPVLHGHWHAFNLNRLFSGLKFQLDQVVRGQQPISQQHALLEQLDRVADSLHLFLVERRYESAWAMVTDDLHNVQAPNAIHYNLNDSGTMGFVVAQPKVERASFSGATEAVDGLRAILADVGPRHPHVTLGLTGVPVLESDEMRSSQQSMLWASLISFGGVAWLLFWGFRGVRHPLLGLLMLAVSMAWAFGFTTLVIGHLNILSVSFVTILVGLGIDYAILYLSRYVELRREGADLVPALISTARMIGPGIVTAATTTSLAFFSAMLTDFLGVAELGIIAGGGIVLCMLAAFTLLPASIAWCDRDVPIERMPRPFAGGFLRELPSRYPTTVVSLSFLILAVVALPCFQVRYDDNLLNLQADGVPSVEVLRRMMRDSDNRVLYGVSLTENPDTARTLKAKFEKLPLVQRVETLAAYLPVHPPEETRLIVDGIRTQLSQLPATMPESQTVDPASVGEQMESLLEPLAKLRNQTGRRLHDKVDRLLDQLDALPMLQQITLLTTYQSRMKVDLFLQLRGLLSVANPEPVTSADFPPAFASRFISPAGKWLLQIYPKEQLWERSPLTRFVEQVRSVDPNVTGTPLQNFEASRQIRESYETIAIYSVFATLLILLIDCLSVRDALICFIGPCVGITAFVGFMHESGQTPSWNQIGWAYLGIVGAMVALIDRRALRNTILAFVPPTFGLVLLMGLLGWLQIDLNPANLIVLPLIVGIGVDSGVHVMHDYRHQQGSYRMSSSTANSVLLTSLSTMVGFGSMMIADHRGLHSLGLVLTLGVGSCLFVAVILLPALLTLLSNCRDNRFQSPIVAESESIRIYLPDAAA